MTYREMVEKHREEKWSLPVSCSFANEGMENVIKELGPEEELVIVSNGVWMRKDQAYRYHELKERHKEEMREAMNDLYFAIEAMSEELKEDIGTTYEPIRFMLLRLHVEPEELDENETLSLALDIAKQIHSSRR